MRERAENACYVGKSWEKGWRGFRWGEGLAEDRVVTTKPPRDSSEDFFLFLFLSSRAL